MRFPPFPRPGPTFYALLAVLLGLVLFAPLLQVATITLLLGLMTFVALAYSLNFITGLTGYVSFGHVVFLGVGSYTLGYLVGMAHWSPLAGVGAGALVGLLLALGIGAVTLRFRGVYFAIASLVTPLAAVQIVLAIPQLNDGQGIVLDLPYTPLTQFLVIWAVVTAEVVLTHLVTHGRIGYGIRAVKSDEDAAKALGIDAARLKLTVFAFSGIFAGAAGAVLAWTNHGVFPEPAFDLGFSLLMLAMIVVGGMGTQLGPFLGAVVVYLSTYYFLTLASAAAAIIIGLLVILIALIIPGGVVGALRDHVPRLRRILE